ncbi:hypothetical protein CW710_02535 [Candidatus Bathyarchaeota archaeon]|nr:MAG: hypothetical protein CW710_02535 [Candidatus Bathyarchaeota archaeon]
MNEFLLGKLLFIKRRAEIYANVLKTRPQLDELMKLIDFIENMDPETLEYLSDTLHYAHERAGLEVLGLRSKLEELKRRKPYPL